MTDNLNVKTVSVGKNLFDEALAEKVSFKKSAAFSKNPRPFFSFSEKPIALFQMKKSLMSQINSKISVLGFSAGF